MEEWLVAWHINIQAESAQEAAEKALVGRLRLAATARVISQQEQAARG